MDRTTCERGFPGLGSDVLALIARFLDLEDIENCLLSCRNISDAFRSAKSQIESDLAEKRRRRDLDRFSNFDMVSDAWSKTVASCQSPVQAVDPREVVVTDRLVGARVVHRFPDFSETSVIESIKVRGTFRRITFEVGAQRILFIGKEVVDVIQPDDDGFVEIFAHFMVGLNKRDLFIHWVQLCCSECDLTFKITCGTARDRAVSPPVNRVVMQPGNWDTVEASDRDVVDVPIHCTRLNAVGVILMVESGTSMVTVLSLDLSFVDDRDRRETRRKICGGHISASEFTTRHGTTAVPLTSGCHFVPLRNLDASLVTKLTLTLRFKDVSDYTVKWVYFCENVFRTASGMGGLLFCN